MLERIADCPHQQPLSRRHKVLSALLLLILPYAPGVIVAARIHHSLTHTSQPSSQEATPQTSTQRTPLAPGIAVTRELSNSQQHAYAVALVKDQFASLEIDVRELSANIKILDPAGELVNVFDTAPSMTGKQKIEFVA